MNAETAFLADIRANPDDDAPRLIYADWLDEHGGPAGAARAEFIRVQCELASLPKRHRRRRALAAREQALLAEHRGEWTDLAFADWLGHRQRACHNPEGHNFCKLVARGIRARCEHDALPEGDPRRRRLERRQKALGRQLEDTSHYTSDTADMPLFDEAEFCRGFVERATVQDFAVDLFAEALSELGVLRSLEIENDSLVEGYGDRAIRRLAGVLGGRSLRELDCFASIDELETVERLAATPGLAALESLALWFDIGDNGDEPVRVLVASPHLTGLRFLEVEHSHAFTDETLRAILDAPSLAGLKRCKLVDNEPSSYSRAVWRRFKRRFGPDA